MPLSKEFYLDEIKSKYPNSYNESLKDLPIKDLEDMLDFLEGALSKADGGSIGIEVLFGPKREDFRIGGRAQRKVPYDSRATAQDYANALKSVSAGTTYQQQADAKRYAKQQASSMLDQAMKSADPNKGPGLQGIYEQFFKNKNTGIGPSTFTPGASGRMMSYSSKDRDRILDQMANQMLNTTNYSQSKVNERREKEYADFMNNLITSTYGKAGDYKAEAMTLNMPTEAYFDYLVTSDPKNKLSTRDVLSKDPYFDPKTYVPTDYSNPETPRPPSPYEVYYQQELKNQISAGIPVGQRIQQGQVMGLPTLVGSGSQMGPGYESYADVVARNKKMLGLKDGGRVGLFMGGDPLTGQALSIYDSMNAYGFTDQEIADALSARGLYTAAGSGTTTQPEQVTGIIGAQLNQDRDDGPKGDFGLFGDLLKDTEKTFTKNVYTQTGPVTFDFVPTEVKGYKNVKTGNYQTEAGKNINHLGLEVPTLAGMLIDKNFGKGPQVGDIEGTFTKGIPTNLFKDPFGIFKKQQATLADINAMNKKAVDDLNAKLAAEKAAKEAAIAAEMARYNITSDSDFGGGVPGGGGGNVTTSGGDVYGGEAYGYNEAEEKTDYYKDGGLATMFKRKR